jgi:hypothetical protein
MAKWSHIFHTRFLGGEGCSLLSQQEGFLVFLKGGEGKI